MSIRIRTFLITLFFSAFLTVSIFLIFKPVIQARYIDLEESFQLQNAEGIQQKIQDTYTRLREMTSDWAAWRYSRQLLHSRTIPTDQNDLLLASLTRNQIDLVIFARRDGEITHGFTWDYSNQEEKPYPEEIKEYLTAELLLKSPSDGEFPSGVVTLANDYYLVNSHSIIDNDSQDIVGYLILGKDLNSVLNLVQKPMNAVMTIEPAQSIIDEVPSNQPLPPYIIKPLDENRILTAFFLKSLVGQPYLAIQEINTRTIYQQGIDTLNYMLYSLIAVGMGIVLVFMMVFEFLVIRPLNRIKSRINEITPIDEREAAQKYLRSAIQEIQQPISSAVDRVLILQKETRTQKELFATLIEQSHDGFAILEPVTLRIRETNKAFWDQLGNPSPQPGDFWTWVNEQNGEPIKQALLQGVTELENGSAFTLSFERKQEAKRFLLDITFSPIQVDDEIFYCVILRDVTHHKQLEQELEKRLDESLLINRIISTTATQMDIRRILEIVCEELATALHLPQAAFALLSENKTELVVTAEFVTAGRPSALGDVIPVENGNLSDWVLNHRQPFTVKDVFSEPGMRESQHLMEKRGTRSLLIVPIISHEQVIGTLGLDSLEPREFSSQEKQIALNAASAVGQAIEIAQLYQELQTELSQRRKAEKALAMRERYLTALTEVQSIFLSLKAGPAAYNLVLAMLGKTAGANRAYLFLDIEGDEKFTSSRQYFEWLDTGFTSHRNLDSLHLRSLESEFPDWTKVLLRGETVTGLQSDFANSEAQFMKLRQIQSILLIPLTINNKVSGFLGFENCHSSERWDGMEIALIQNAAGAIDLAVENQVAERALLQSQTSLTMMLDQLPTFLWTTDKNLNITWLHGTVLGKRFIAGENLANLDIHPDALSTLIETHRQALAGNEVSFEVSLNNRNYRVIADPFRDKNGEIIGVLGLAEDFTDRKVIEGELKEQRDLATQVMTSMGQGLIILDNQGTFRFVNQSFANMLGYQTAELIGRPINLVTLPEQETLFKLPDSAVKGNFQHSIEIQLKTKEGSEVFVQSTLVPMLRNGDVDGSISVVTDLTERKKYENYLRSSQDTLRALYNITSSQDLNFKEKIRSLLVLGCQRFDMKNGVLSRIDGKFLQIEEGFLTAASSKPGDRILLEDTFSSELIQQQVQLAIPMVKGTPRENTPAYKRYKLESFIGTPILVNGKIYGTVFFSSPLPHKPFEPVDLDFLRLIGQWIGSEIEREQYTSQLKTYADEIIQKNLDLAEARDQALEASRLKSEFLATMSHEIRTPMNAVVGMTDLLIDTSLDSEQKEYASIVRDSAGVLLTLINDILDFSKIEAGKLSLEEIDFDPINVFESIVDLFSSKAAEKGLRLLSWVDPQIPTPLRGDPTRLRQVVMNMVSNAVKFTESGHVVVKAWLKKVNDAGVRIYCEVTDTGIGLTDVARERLFQPFTQADGSTTRKYGGTGLGLAISRRLVEAMNGKIGVKSQQGKGSTFWFEISLKPSNQAQLSEKIGHESSLKNQFALIIDSDKERRQIIQDYLTAWGMTCAVTGDSRKILTRVRKACESGSPINYLFLPTGQSGACQLIEDLQNEAADHRPHLICLLPTYQRPKAAECLDKGCSTYLIEPVKQSNLRRALLVCSGVLAPDFPGAATQAQDAFRKVSLQGNVLLAEDNPANQKLALIQLERIGVHVDIVQNGLQAVEKIRTDSANVDLILMDCQMPEIDGYEATRRIRRFEAHSGRHTPIIAMTANALDADREICLMAGMDDYIAKPVSVDQLQLVLTKWLPITKSQAELPDNERLSGSTDSLLDSDTIQSIRDLQSTDHPNFLSELIDIYLSDSVGYIQKAKTALDAMDLSSFSRAIHTLKGASASLGGIKLTACIVSIENQIKDGKTTDLASRFEELNEIYKQTCSVLQKIKST